MPHRDTSIQYLRTNLRLYIQPGHVLNATQGHKHPITQEQLSGLYTSHISTHIIQQGPQLSFKPNLIQCQIEVNQKKAEINAKTISKIYTRSLNVEQRLLCINVIKSKSLFNNLSYKVNRNLCNSIPIMLSISHD